MPKGRCGNYRLDLSNFWKYPGIQALNDKIYEGELLTGFGSTFLHELFFLNTFGLKDITQVVWAGLDATGITYQAKTG